MVKRHTDILLPGTPQIMHEHDVSDLSATGTPSASTYLRGDGTWTTPGGSGDVVGPASAVDGNVVLFDTTTGKLIKDSGLTLAGNNTGDQDLSSYLTSATAASTYQPLMGADDNYVTDAEKTALHPAVTIGTNTASALSLSTQQLSIGDVFVQNTGDTIAGDISINSGYRLAVGGSVSTSADVRINSTAVNESSLYVGLWQSVSYNPVGTPVAGTNVRGLLFQVSTPATADDLSNVILYGALGQVTHGGSGALGQAIGMNPGIFLTGSGNVVTSAGITVGATASGGGAHTTWYGVRSGGITLSGGSTMVNSYAFYADAVAGATNNYAWLSNAGLFVVNETGDASSDLRVEGDTNTHLLITDASADCVGINVTAPAGKLDIQQTSTTAAIPTLILDQSDLSEEFIQFESTVGAGNPIDTAALGTYYGKIRISVNGTFKFMALYNT